MKTLNKLFPMIIVFAVFLVYYESFSGIFIFDDYIWIVDNKNITSFWPSLLCSSRPLIGLTFHLNYLFGDLKAPDYHAVNLLIHITSVLLLFGILRRTLELPRFEDKVGSCATLLAGTVSLIWGIHPIQTESVTYIVQRSESLMGMFYLLTLYCFIRGLTLQNGNNRYYLWGIVSCSMGMLCKPVMVTAPLLVLLYDGIFIAGSLRKAFRQHGSEYLLLFATLVIPACLLSVPNESSSSAGFDAIAIGPFQYFVTQSGVIIHYIKLVLWPVGLCLDYDWPPAGLSVKTIFEIFMVTVAVVISFLMFFKQRPEGFIGVSFFIMLFPSSGIIPLSDCAAEHRMYLPSACIILLVILGLCRLVRPICGKDIVLSGVILFFGVVVSSCLGIGTIDRNRLYLSEERIWNDVVSKYPANLRGHLGLGTVFLKRGDFARAEFHFVHIIEDLRSKDMKLCRRYGTEFAMAYNNLGVIAFERKQLDKAKEFFERSLSFGTTINAECNLRLVADSQKKGSESRK